MPMGADVRRCRPKVTDDGSHQALPAGGCKNDLVLSSRACPAVIDLTGEQPLTKRCLFPIYRLVLSKRAAHIARAIAL